MAESTKQFLHRNPRLAQGLKPGEHTAIKVRLCYTCCPCESSWTIFMQRRSSQGKQSLIAAIRHLRSDSVEQSEQTVLIEFCATPPCIFLFQQVCIKNDTMADSSQQR